MLTIITPCCRQSNLPKLYDSIQFDKIFKWIIVYDTSKNRSYKKMYETTPYILEIECDTVGVAGHPQRNFGMKFVEDGFIYFLDDDNIIHPTFWSFVEMFNPTFFYTFNQERSDNFGPILNGNRIEIFCIDTAMFVVHKEHCKDIEWNINYYNADGRFITDILTANPNCHIYINKVGAYYNYLS